MKKEQIKFFLNEAWDYFVILMRVMMDLIGIFFLSIAIRILIGCLLSTL
jgi:hypothetical protein